MKSVKGLTGTSMVQVVAVNSEVHKRQWYRKDGSKNYSGVTRCNTGLIGRIFRVEETGADADGPNTQVSKWYHNYVVVKCTEFGRDQQLWLHSSEVKLVYEL